MKKYCVTKAMALLFITVLSVGAICGASYVWAQEKGGLAKQIQGSWVLVSIYNEQDGKKTHVFGPNPKGSMILTPDGRFSTIMIRADLPKFASNNRIKGTAEENKAVVHGSIAQFGTYQVVSEKDHTLNFHHEGCTFPNWNDQDNKRVIIVTGDEMKLTAPGTEDVESVPLTACKGSKMVSS